MKPNKGFALLVAVLLAAACNDDDGPRELTLGEPQLTEIAAPAAVATAEVRVDPRDLDTGAIRVMAYGFCYGTAPSPTTHGATVRAMPDSGRMQAVLTDLADNTLYYVRAFATLYPEGVVYSPEVEMSVGTVAAPAE